MPTRSMQAALAALALLTSGPLAAGVPKGVGFPEKLYFKPLMAYHKDPRFFVSFRSYDVKSAPYKDSYRIAAVGYGTVFGLYEWPGAAEGDGLQIGFGGGLFAQFNLGAKSKDLINADYTVGIPLLWRRGDNSARVSLYHQSSHLGDEFLLNFNPQRVNLSYEAIQGIFSHEWAKVRLYGGGEYLLGPEPSNLDRGVALAGVEYYGQRVFLKHGRFVAGLDLQSYEEHDWHIDAALKFGLEFRPRAGGHSLSVLVEAFDGYAPHGQFYDIRINYIGIGVSFGL